MVEQDLAAAPEEGVEVGPAIGIGQALAGIGPDRLDARVDIDRQIAVGRAKHARLARGQEAGKAASVLVMPVS
jgi:hypothetical protein